MTETADSIATRIVAQTEAAERELRAYGKTVERVMAEAERAVAGAAARQREAWRQLAVGLGGATTAAPNAPGIEIGVDAAQLEAVTALIAELGTVDLGRFEIIDGDQIARMAKVSSDLADGLAKSLTEAITAGKSLGDGLVDAFARAGAALIQSQILRLLNPAGDGSGGLVGGLGEVLGSLVGVRKPAARASGGHVSAGQLYRVNEGGTEGFRPAGSGVIVPLGRMAAPRASGGVTVVQPMNVSFAGAITTPELMAEFRAYADRVGQAAALGGAAMAQARLAKRAARALG